MLNLFKMNNFGFQIVNCSNLKSEINLLIDIWNFEFPFVNIHFMNKKKIVEERIRDSVSDGKISCTELRKIAEEADASYRLAGRVADKLNVKIIKCELGCF